MPLVLMVAATLMSVCSAGPVCLSAPVRIAERAAAAPLHRNSTPPQAAAASTRPTRLCSISQRSHREAGGPPVWFHFEPQIGSAALGRAAIASLRTPATVTGSSRAPPSAPSAR